MRTITPEGSAYHGDAVQLDLVDVEGGETAIIAAPDGIEAAVVLLAGIIDFNGRRASRDDVFGGPATAVYLPPGTAIEVGSTTGATLALAATVGGELDAPRARRPRWSCRPMW